MAGNRSGGAWGKATPIITGGVSYRAANGLPSPSVGTQTPNTGGRILPPPTVGTLGGYGPANTSTPWGIASPKLVSFGATFGPPAVAPPYLNNHISEKH